MKTFTVFLTWILLLFVTPCHTYADNSDEFNIKMNQGLVSCSLKKIIPLINTEGMGYGVILTNHIAKLKLNVFSSYKANESVCKQLQVVQKDEDLEYCDITFTLSNGEDIRFLCFNPEITEYDAGCFAGTYTVDIADGHCKSRPYNARNIISESICYYANLFSIYDIKKITFNNSLTLTLDHASAATIHDMFKQGISRLDNKSWFSDFNPDSFITLSTTAPTTKTADTRVLNAGNMVNRPFGVLPVNVEEITCQSAINELKKHSNWNVSCEGDVIFISGYDKSYRNKIPTVTAFFTKGHLKSYDYKFFCLKTEHSLTNVTDFARGIVSDLSAIGIKLTEQSATDLYDAQYTDNKRKITITVGEGSYTASFDSYYVNIEVWLSTEIKAY